MYQELIAVRMEIIEALSVDVRTRGQLEIDGSAVIKPLRRKKPVDEETKAVLFRDPVHAVESRSSKGGHCPLPDNAFKHVKVARAVNALPDHLNSLAQFSYAEKAAWCHTETVSFSLWRHFLSLQSSPLRKKKEKVLKGMVLLAMQNWKHLLTAEKDIHKPARVRELLGVSDTNWVRDWLPFWRQFHDILSEMDSEVLTHVYESTGKTTDNRAASAA